MAMGDGQQPDYYRFLLSLHVFVTDVAGTLPVITMNIGTCDWYEIMYGKLSYKLICWNWGYVNIDMNSFIFVDRNDHVSNMLYMNTDAFLPFAFFGLYL